jgi:hypothetical protein
MRTNVYPFCSIFSFVPDDACTGFEISCFRFLSFVLAVSAYDVLWLSRYDLYD